MSSSNVRSAFKTFLSENSSEVFIDLTAQFAEIQDMIAEAGLTHTDNWVGLEFLGGDELPVSVHSTNSAGRYREHGTIPIHIVSQAKLGAGPALLSRGETLRDLLRGRRIGSILIDSVTPMNFNAGATLQFEGGYMAGSFTCAYQYELNL